MVDNTLPNLPYGRLLERYREDKGLTQAELAERAGVSESLISKHERDEVERPRQVTIKLLADALELTPEERDWLRAAARGRRPDVPAVHEPAQAGEPSQESAGAGEPSAAVPAPVAFSSAATEQDIQQDTVGTDGQDAVVPAVQQPKAASRRRPALHGQAMAAALIVLLAIFALAAWFMSNRVSSEPPPAPVANRREAGQERPGQGSLVTEKPGGLWVQPAHGAQFTVSRGASVTFEMQAYPTGPRDPDVSRVDVTVSWPGKGWVKVCTATQPVREKTFACSWPVEDNETWPDLSQPFTADVRVTFNVIDVGGQHNNAPHGSRTIQINYQP